MTNLEKIQEMTSIMLHHANGGEVLSRPYHSEEEEFQLDLMPAWNWERYKYKIAPCKKVIYVIFSKDKLISASLDKADANRVSLSYNLPITIFKEL
jgi:hypothetical protein